MAIQAVRIVMLLGLVITGADAYRMKRKSKDHVKNQPSERADEQQSLDATLRERSGATQSLVEDKQVSLDAAVERKGDNRRRRRQSSNGWCLPHQQCTWHDCCALGTSCNTCPGGYHGEKAFGRCAFKGHYVCNSRDCKGSWDAWSSCSARCGGGTRRSVYRVVHHAQGGRGCPAHNGQTKTEQCNMHACPIDCVGSWSSFGSCSLTCGGGQQSQTFTITTAAQHGGKQCPHRNGETRSQACNAQACPVDCQGDWSEYSACSATCGSGTQTRQFAVSVPAQHGGAACSPQGGQTESKSCKTQDCCPAYPGNHPKTGACIDRQTEEDALECCCSGGCA